MQLSLETYRRICIAALLALSGIIVTGAAVRLTGSGLGCSDWPTCEHDQLVADMGDFHGLVEQVNRYITGLVAVAVILATLGSLRLRPRRPDLTRWSWVLVIGVAAQILIGAAVTLSDLRYSVVALHFLVSMLLVGAAVVLVERAGIGEPRRVRAPGSVLAVTVLAAAVLVTGSVVTSAGPHAGDRDVARLPVDLARAAQVHSVTVWLFCAAVVVLALRLRRTGDPALLRRVLDLLVATVVQGAIGYAQYFTGVPALLVALHVAGATLVWILSLRVHLACSLEEGVAPHPPIAEEVAAA